MKVKLTDVCTPKQWKTISTNELLEKGYPVYGANGLIGHYSEYNHEQPVVTITCRGATCGAVNVTVPKSYVNGNAMCLDNLCPNVLLHYLYYCLLHYDFSHVISGSAQPQITRQGLEKVEIEVCSIEQQIIIVDSLRKIEAVITARQQQLHKLDELVKARFVEMFGDPVENPMKWETMPFLSIGDCKNGMNFHYEDSGVDIHCLGVGDFKNHSTIRDTTALPKVSLNEMPTDEYLLKDEDIVFVRSNGNKALVGRSVAVYPGNTPTTFSGFCIRYRKNDDSVAIQYLLRVLKCESIRRKMAGRGANIQNLNQQILSNLVIPIPPIELQNQFADFIAQCDKSKFVVQQALEKAQLLFDSLMQQYFG